MHSSQEEIQIMARLASGEKEALGELVERYGRPIYSFVYQMIRNERDAEEIVQDVFVSVWKNAATYKPGAANPFTWLSTVARNKTIDRIRHAGRRIAPPPATDDNPAHESPDPAPDPAMTTEVSERAQQLAAMVAELPANQREAIELAYFEGLTHSEISERLSETPGTVKSLIRLGIEKLRTKMKEGLK